MDNKIQCLKKLCSGVRKSSRRENDEEYNYEMYLGKWWLESNSSI